MKKHLLFNQLFGTEGSPNQTGETQTRENRIGLMSYLRRTLMLLFTMLTLACGNAWGDTSYYMFTPTKGSEPAHTGTFSGDFLGNSGSSSSTTRTINGFSMSKGYRLSAVTNLNGVYYGSSYTAYDIKTTQTTFTIYYYNNASADKVIYYALVEEGATSAPTPVKICDATKSTTGYQEFTVNTTTNAKIAFYSTDNSNMYVYQLVAVEKGTAHKKAGEAGYEIAFKSVIPRYTNNGSARDGSIDGLEFTALTNDFKLATSSSTWTSVSNGIKVKISGTNYLKFRNLTADSVKVEVSSSKTYYIGTANNTTSNSSTSTQTVALTHNQDYYIVPGGNEVEITKISFKATSASCTAPNHVDITPMAEDDNYGWRYTIGETLKLTATAYSSADTGSPISAGNITGYQWQKLVGSVWEDLSDGGTISGATTANLQISNLTSSNGGNYRCQISTGATCTTESGGYWVRIFTLNGNYYGEEWTENPIVWTGENTGVATVNLNASKTYLFKVTDNDGKWFGSGAGNYIIESGDSKDCGAGDPDIRLFTGPAGNYTFTVNVENAAGGSAYVNVVTGYPSVSHPAEGYMYLTKWWDCYPHWWDGSSNALTSDGNDPKITKYTTICGTDYWYMPVLDNYTNVYFKNNATWNSASEHGETTTSTGHSGQYYTHNGVSWGWHEFTTYTISFANGGGSGSMAAITGICPNGSQTLPANTFEKTGYTFAGWKDASSNDYADEATISSITSNITLTAQWSPKSCTVSFDNNGGTGGTNTVTATYDAEMPSKASNLPTKAGYDFAGYYDSETNDDGTGTKYYNADGTSAQNWDKNTTSNTTLYAKWTAKTYTVTLDPDNSASTVTVTATYDAAMPSKLSDGETSVAVPTFTNYVFGGYFDDHCGAGTQYYTNAVASANTWDKTSATTLYAKWTQSITLDREGATTGSTSVTATYKSATLPSITNPEKDGYTFEGWYDGDDGTGNLVISKAGALQANVSGYTGAGGIWTSSSTRTLHAKWEEEETTYEDKIVWAKNSDYGGEGKCMSSDDANTTAKDNNDKNDLGHSYVQISSTNTGMRRPANVDDVFSVTFTAKSGYYIKSICTYGKIEETDGANYSWDGGSNWTNIAKYSSQATKTFDAPSATEPTSFIIKYTCTNTGSGGIYWRNAVITLGDASASTYTVSVAANPAGYGTVSAASVTSVASGTTLSASTNTLSVGATNVTATATSASAEYTYSFNNWTKNDGTALPLTVTSDLSVYANFTRTANNYTLTWNTNGGSDLDCDGCTSGSTAYNTTLVAPSDPTLSNYTFDGWNTANDGSGSAAAATMPAANTTYYAAWKQTVTLTTGAQGSGSNQTPVVYLNGTGVSSFTAHTATGYTLQGYYTAGSGGTKVLNADGTFAAANVTDYITSSKWSRTGAAPTLYAQWVAAEDCHTLKYAWKIAGKFCDDESTSVTASDTVRFPANASNLYFTVSGTGNTVSKGSSYNLGNTQNNYFLLTAKTGYQIKSICFYGKVQDSSVDYTTNGSSWSALESTKTDGDDYYSFNNINASHFGIKLTAATPEGIWIRNMVIEVCASGDVTYNVTYDDNGKTGGAVPSDATNYSYGTTVTVKGNTGDLAKTNYTFAGWTTNNNGTGSSYVADNTFSITANTTLYAKWTQSVTLEKNGGSTDGSATAVWNATGLTGITHAMPASGYKLLGYYSASSDGTKVLNSDGSFAATNVTGYITDGKWSRTSATTLYAEYESAGALTWNLIVNSDTTNLSTSTKTSAFTEISTSNMSNATLKNLTYSGDKKSNLTGKISTPSSYTSSDYVYVTFQVASGYKFTPSSVKVKAQPVTSAKSVKLVLEDEKSHSINFTTASTISGGSTQTVEMTNGSSVYFEGTVTLKIYCYGATDKYRLGTPITIEGEVEEACATMPSYSSMSYTTTTFAPGADASGSPITIVGGENIDTYQWKYNTVNDRTSGTNCGTGTSLTPLTNAEAATDGTRYYWCEMTNDDCGITIKSPAVAITVASAKSDATVTWTDPATPNYGGGGYTIKATVNETEWDGNAADLVITAPAGIRIYNVTSGTDGNSRKYVQVNFDVQTSFDRTTYASNIPFTVSAAATASYNAISDDHNVSYSACTGGAASEELMPVNADSVNSTVKGWRFAGTGKMWFGHGSSTPGTGSSNIKSLSNTMAGGAINKYYNSGGSYFSFYTETAITGVRLYVYTSNSNVKVSNVYIANSQFATGTPSSGAVTYEVVYNDDNEGLDKGDNVYSAWAEITFASEVAAGKYGLIKLDNNVKIAGIGLLSGSSGADLTTTLAFATPGPINDKTQSSVNFTNAASVTAYSETLGKITYSSSNTSCATVNPTTGEVTITASGADDLSTTITATLSASGCYKSATATYTINIPGVSCTVETGTLTSDVTSKCSTEDATLTLAGFESGASVQWYKGESTISDDATYDISDDGTTLVTSETGTYSVMVTNSAGTCSDRSNSITISNISATASVTKIVDEWYVKNGRLTPDIELWSLSEGATLKSVAWSPDNETGLSCVARGGVIYLEGKSPSSNDSGDIEYTLTATITDECNAVHEETTKTIKITHQKNTDKHVLAFVVTGTEKGGFTAGITAAQTTSVGLYNAIAEQFDVQTTNIYATDDEKKLKEYYSQYDILCITDYPNTQTKGVNKKSYVDALGALVDIRPILTMEAFVSKLANWKAIGISGNPKSPTTRQYTMDLQCKDHEIFAGTKLTKVGEGDEAMYRVSMVCDTLEDYKTLDATYGGGAHAEKTDYNYGGKPALQGFTFTQEMIDNDLLPIGLIDDGAGNPLQVGIERQHNMEARLMVLGINSYAMERLTDDGERVVINALNYLMKKNAEDIADCSTSFVGGAEGDTKNWDNKDNWTGNTVPLPSQKVRILADCEVSSTVYAQSVLIVTDGKYNHGSDNAAGKLTIKENGALIVGGKIQAASAPAYNRPRATTPEKLLIETSSTNQAALIFDNEEGETQATVNYHSKGYNDGDFYQFQYFAIPMDYVAINPVFADEANGVQIYTYAWDEPSNDWERRGYYSGFSAFEGLAITTTSDSQMDYTLTGNLASTAEREITLTHGGGGDNMIGNSWMAPINIASLVDAFAEDENVEKTVYIYCAGNDTVSGGDGVDINETVEEIAGQWLSIPMGLTTFPDWGGLKVIPAMQAYLIKATGETTLTLNYDEMVRSTAETALNEKLRAPKRRTVHNEDKTLTRLRVADSRTHTDLYFVEGDVFSDAFDNGWEATYMPNEGASPQFYAMGVKGKMAVLATDDFEGTVVGFEPGKETAYTISFSGAGNGYYLNDVKTQASTLIIDGEAYSFEYEAGDDANRFYISRTPLGAPAITTGINNPDAAAPKVLKVIYNDKLYIIRGGKVYSADGQVVK